MKIAQISPLFESVPPQAYGGTERVVSYLTEELVRMGHEVTLFASGDSVTQANLVAICPRSLRLDKECIDVVSHHMLLVEQVFQQAAEFDVIHSHIDYLTYSMARQFPQFSLVTTLHGRLDIPDLVPLYQEFDELPVISISDDQRKPLPWINWQGTVYHGLPPDLYTYRKGKGNYLAFVGRMSPEKRVDLAIEIAIRTGMPLKIAAKVDKADLAYFEKIRHLLDHPLVEFVGEIGEKEKNDFIGNAAALIFPIDWPEPFGLVMIEAMACGTPVIARRCGSVPEVIENGVTGFIVDDTDQAVEAVNNLRRIDRRGCRKAFEERFTSTRMAQDYLKIYDDLIHPKEGWSLLGVQKP
jgi:glycosyltransferase involved in cell wall biosynthesis